MAGISRMRWETFTLYNALGGTVWATAVVLVGYLVGEHRGSERWLGRATLLLAVLVAVVVGCTSYTAGGRAPGAARRLREAARSYRLWHDSEPATKYSSAGCFGASRRVSTWGCT